MCGQSAPLQLVHLLVSHELQERTSAEWVRCLVTWFADDSHLGWHIRTQRDLDFVCRSLHATFALLRECGMCANPLKSTVVLGIKGSYAKRWIKAHTVICNGRRCIEFGVPGSSLAIPVANQCTYLGTTISFHAHELQTCKHRLQIAQAQRTRLLRFLHSRQLSLQRVTLYLSCARSTMLYGLHAVGITDAVLQKIETALSQRHALAAASSRGLQPVSCTHWLIIGLPARLVVSTSVALRTCTRTKLEAWFHH